MITIVAFVDFSDDIVSFRFKAAQVRSREIAFVEIATDERVSSRLNPQFLCSLFIDRYFSMLYVANDWSHPYVIGVDVEQVS